MFTETIQSVAAFYSRHHKKIRGTKKQRNCKTKNQDNIHKNKQPEYDFLLGLPHSENNVYCKPDQSQFIAIRVDFVTSAAFRSDN